ncbi:hypothetical protein AUJ84_04640 [Candidatus Pacearchaeota archaeon CG1_02_32_132]|nr:MAG: hypothetical protein AUJ84_04640 [Candidatus Pacearchaeota archaeon CG1_02_32_132]
MESKLYFFLLFFLLLSLSIVQATFSVSSLYYKDNPLSGMRAGESKEIKIILSNPSEEKINVEVSFLKGEEIASLLGGSIYELSQGQKIEVPIKIDIPRDAQQGENYEVNILSDSLSTGNEGSSVQFSPNYITSFVVIVGDKAVSVNEPKIVGDEKKVEPVSKDIEKSKSETIFKIFYFALSLMILVLFVVIVIVVRRRKRYFSTDSQYLSNNV